MLINMIFWVSKNLVNEMLMYLFQVLKLKRYTDKKGKIDRDRQIDRTKRTKELDE